MSAYIGTKLVDATEMTRLAYNELRGWPLPRYEEGSDEGYLVEYIDGGPSNHPDYNGYISWSPKEVFEQSYRPAKGMTFGLAVDILKKGGKIARKGWNGKGMYITLVPKEGAMNAYMTIKNVDDSISTWVPSVNDCLAEDWRVVE